MAESSTKPYLIRAIYEWCNDNGYTPYVAVAVDEQAQVPREFVKGGEIVLNVSPSATNRLSLGNEMISFQARFGGAARDLSFPVDAVSAIYARENGHGMAFDVPKAMAVSDTDEARPADTPGTSETAGPPEASDAADGSPPVVAKAPAAGPRVASSGPRAVGPRMAIASTSAPKPVSASSTVRDGGAGDQPAGESPPEGSPDGNTPRGRPRLTRIK
jgi:stringent starvation protein B